MNPVQSHYSAPPTVVPFDRNVQNVSTRLEMTVGEDGKTQTVVKDNEGSPIRYIPAVSIGQEIKMKIETERQNQLDFLV